MKKTKILSTFLPLGVIIPTTSLVVSCGSQEKEYVDEDPKVFSWADYLHRKKNNLKPLVPEGVEVLEENSLSHIDLDFPIPNSVKVIEKDAFRYSKVKPGFELPDSVEKMGEWTFAFTTFYTDIKWPYKVERVPVAAFLEADFSPLDDPKETISHTGIIWPEKDAPSTVKVIGNNAFNKAKLPWHFEIPSGLEKVEYSAFNEVDYPWEIDREIANGEIIRNSPLSWPQGPDLDGDGYGDGVLVEDGGIYYDLGKKAPIRDEDYRFKLGDPTPFIRYPKNKKWR